MHSFEAPNWNGNIFHCRVKEEEKRKKERCLDVHFCDKAWWKVCCWDVHLVTKANEKLDAEISVSVRRPRSWRRRTWRWQCCPCMAVCLLRNRCCWVISLCLNQLSCLTLALFPFCLSLSLCLSISLYLSICFSLSLCLSVSLSHSCLFLSVSPSLSLRFSLSFWLTGRKTPNYFLTVPLFLSLLLTLAPLCFLFSLSLVHTLFLTLCLCVSLSVFLRASLSLCLSLSLSHSSSWSWPV